MHQQNSVLWSERMDIGSHESSGDQKPPEIMPGRTFSCNRCGVSPVRPTEYQYFYYLSWPPMTRSDDDGNYPLNRADDGLYHRVWGGDCPCGIEAHLVAHDDIP